MSLRLNRSEPLFRRILKLPRIGRRPRTRDDLRLRRNLPLSFLIVRRKPEQTFTFRILLAMILDFHLQTYNLEDKSSMTNFQRLFQALYKIYYSTITIDKNISNRFLQTCSIIQKDI